MMKIMMVGLLLMEDLKVDSFLSCHICKFYLLSYGFLYVQCVAIDKGSEDEDLPSMDALEINERDTTQPRCGGDEEEEIPDMEDFDDIDNDPVSWLYIHMSFARF